MYTNLAVFLDHRQCTVSNGLRNCQTEEGAHPALLSSSADLVVYHGIVAYPVTLTPLWCWTFPKLGWCVGSVEMTFVAPSTIPALSLSLHSTDCLTTNTDKTVFSNVSEEGTGPVVMNLTALACGNT